MVNPQLENGHTRIANEILERIMKLSLNGTQFRLVLAIWRFTYGFQRKDHLLSLSFLTKAIEASRSQVDRELTALIERKVIVIRGNGSRGARVMAFNKNHEEWIDRPLNRGQSPLSPNQSTEPSSTSGTVLSSNPRNKKERTKEKKKETRQSKRYDEDNTYYKMAKVFHELVTDVAKDAGVEHLTRKANLQKWSDDFRKLVELDGVEDKAQIHRLMKWVTQHDFWRTNVLSAKKFREKYADLAIKMNSESMPKKHPSHYQKDSRDIEIARNKWIANGGDPDEFTF
ncbi:replication protein [Alkalihalophilus lindianensis]|uniref:Replication protein n=1 Tax=Alkalihalophilus lindianensis TaxID=1630542 RepID=A0ABU3X797_9BACI|nr:replication protein [Alkalihalophilus lindianensis]MDV2683766.1 replication protein [Alkalihalophilus lindianensis]MDV2683832.1 replication protein [Alkalihalophilus lindianensis]